MYKKTTVSFFVALFFVFFTGSLKAQYCIPNITNGCGAGDRIEHFSTSGGLINISNLNSGCNSGSYDFIDDQQLMLVPGDTFEFTVQSSNIYPQYFSIWIDWNDDGDFDDPGEFVWDSDINSINPFTDSIVTPSQAGEYRMRVRSDYDSVVTDACASSSFGETEDYIIELTGNPPSCLPASSLTASNVTGSSAELSWNDNNGGGIQWKIEWGETGFTPGTGDTAIVSSNPYTLSGLNSLTEYDFYISAICSAGDTSSVSGPALFTTLFECPQFARCFTNAGATGRFGPGQAALDSVYSGTQLQGEVVSENGLQLWEPPSAGNYKITAIGASGGHSNSNTGGKGASISGVFSLSGDTVIVLVGQRGQDYQSGGTGGGGSFVSLLDSTPLIAAGGGAGASEAPGNHPYIDAKDTGRGPQGGAGSTDFGGGGGFLTDGTNTNIPATNGKAFVNGGNGGAGSGFGQDYMPITIEGGFGGGASYDDGGMGGMQLLGGTGTFNSPTYSGGAPGGGYSGGDYVNAGTNYYGGGSYNSGAMQVNSGGVNEEHGIVIIEQIPSQPDDAGITAIDSPAVFCPGNEDVVVTVQNFGTTVIDSVEIHWTVNGTPQTPVTYTGTLDTLNGSNPGNARVNLGSFAFSSAQYQITAWTENPNGVADPENSNDTAQTTVQSGIPAPDDITATAKDGITLNVNWTGGSQQNSWLVSVVEQGNSPDTAGAVTVNVDSAEISGLDPLTRYDVYVKEICSGGADSSNWSDPVSVTTPFYCPPGAYCFQTGGAEGREGPDQAELDAVYAGTSLAGQVTSNNGIQLWTVPDDGNYRITAYGARGGNVAYEQNGGKGAYVEAEFELDQGTPLSVIVGQRGIDGENNWHGGGGGGGSFVWKSNDTTQPLIAAGGGAGSGGTGATSGSEHADTATAGNPNGVGDPGGINGNGGWADTNSAYGGGGGAGWYTNGMNGSDNENGMGGFSPLNGGLGGADTSFNAVNEGGFGGGGSDGYDGGGGGGGYSGGAGGTWEASNPQNGGGGGSYASGLFPYMELEANEFEGFVIVDPVCLTPDSLAAQNITDSSAVISYHGDTANDYVVEWGVSGFTPGNGTADTVYSTLQHTLNGLGANTDYSVYVRALCGPRDESPWTDSVTFTTTCPDIDVDFTITPVHCGETSNGNLLVQVSGGIAPYQYSWHEGSLQNELVNIPAGTYHVTVEDAAGCTAEDSAVVPDAGSPQVQLTVDNEPQCFGGTSGAISSGISGGAPPYSYEWSTSSTSQDISGLPAGTYSLTVTDSLGCETADTATVHQPAILSVQFNVTDVSCSGGSDGEIQTNVTGGTGNYSYNWDQGLSGQNPNNLSANSYALTVTDANGCTAEDTATVSEPVQLTVSTQVLSDVSCYGGSDGQAEATASGGTGNTTFTWSDNQTGNTVSSLSAGSYSVTVTDDNGCADSASVTISEPPALSLNLLNSTDVTCNGLSNGSVETEASGGTLPYTFAWADGASDSIRGGLPGGTYEVTITDAQGCTDTLLQTINEPLPLNLNVQLTSDILCAGDSTAAAAANVSGGTAPYNYQWSSGATTDQISGEASGTYAVTVTDDHGCQVEDSVSTSAPAPLSVSAQVLSDVSCHGGSDGQAEATASGGTGTLTLTWPDNQTGNTASGLSAGSYSVIVTDDNGCTDSASVTVAEPAPINISVADTQHISCFGETDGGVTVQASGGNAPYAFLWSDGASDSVLTGKNAGQYMVTVTDNGGCSDSLEVTINEPQQLTASINELTEINCHGASTGALYVSGSGGTAPYQYNWNTGNQTDTLNGITAGVYLVTVTDDNGCSMIQSYAINQPSQLAGVLMNTQDVSCKGEADGSASAIAYGGTTPYQYTWSNGASGAIGTGFAQGAHSVTVTDSAGCTDVLNFQIDEPDSVLLTAEVLTGISCQGAEDASAAVHVTGGSGSFTYAWSNGQGNTTATMLGAGTHSVTVTDINGCADSAEVTVSDKSPVDVSMQAQSASCHGASDGTASAQASGGEAPYSYSWSTGDSAASINGLISNVYLVTVTDSAGCSTISSVYVNEPAPLNVEEVETQDVYCNGGSDGTASATVTGGTSPYTYAWSDGDSADHAQGLTAGTYSVTVTDANGCIDSAVFSLSEPDSLQLSAQVLSGAACPGTADGAAEAFAEGGSGMYAYEWSTGSNSAGVFNLTQGTYSVTVTDDNGCSDSASVTIEAGALPDTGVEVSNGSELIALAEAPGIQFRWYDCDEEEIIAGETGRVFAPEENGSYALIIQAGECRDTSSCYYMGSVSAQGRTADEFGFNLYPNPNNGSFQIRYTGNTEEEVLMQIMDMQGKEIFTKKIGRISGEHTEQLHIEAAAGIYFIKTVRGGEVEVNRFVVY